MESIWDVLDSTAANLMSTTKALPQSRTNGNEAIHMGHTFGKAAAIVSVHHFDVDRPLGVEEELFFTKQQLPLGKQDRSKHEPYIDAPTNGSTRSYDFTITAYIAPDGYEVSALLVNGAFPGPLIEANWGDTIVVTVHNNITGPEEGMALHWHGFLQTDTPWEDGVPGVTQCPLAPGRSETYTFNASLYGSTWYHSHYSAQYSSGVVGPMVVYGPSSEVNYDVDIGPVMLSDWFHTPYLDILEQILAPGGSPLYYSDNNLINGKMNFDCSTVKAGDTTPCANNAGVAEFVFQTGKTHRLRLMNTGAEGVQRFSIDGHVMTVMANDFVPVQPYNTTVVTLGVGQRTDVLVTADAGPAGSAFWMRSNITSCSLANQPYAVAAVYYDDAAGQNATAAAAPTSTAWPVNDPGTCTNDHLSVTTPLYAMALPEPDITNVMNVSLFTNASDVTLWSFGNVSFRGDYNQPVLELAAAGNFSYPAEWNVVNLGDNTAVRIIVNNESPSAHPMHLHGHNYYVLSEGAGAWDGTIVRAANPQRRDVQLVRGQGHLVLQFDGNPGVWAFHCHIAWHASGGFFSSLLVSPDAIASTQLPGDVANTCQGWNAWTSRNVPDQIDSGL